MYAPAQERPYPASQHAQQYREPSPPKQMYPTAPQYPRAQVPPAPTMAYPYSQDNIVPVSKAQARAEDAHHKTNTAYSDTQSAYMHTRQAVKEENRITSAQVIGTQVRADAEKLSRHHEITLKKIERMEKDIEKAKKNMKKAKTKIFWSWVVFPVSFVCGVATCGMFFPPSYFRNKKRHYNSKMETTENELLKLTQVNSVTSHYSNVDNMSTNDNDARGADEDGDTAYFRQQRQQAPVMFIR